MKLLKNAESDGIDFAKAGATSVAELRKIDADKLLADEVLMAM
jgi:hypothetical protein